MPATTERLGRLGETVAAALGDEALVQLRHLIRDELRALLTETLPQQLPQEMTTDQVMEVLDCSPATLKLYREAGKLHAVTNRKPFRFARKEVEALAAIPKHQRLKRV